MNRLWVRLTIAFLIVAWLGIGAVALVVQNTTERSFRRYLDQRNTGFFSDELVRDLEAYYAANGTWTGADDLLPGPRGGGNGQGQGAGRGQGGVQTVLASADGVIVLSSNPDRIGASLSDATREYATELRVDGARVGWLAQETPGAQALGEAENEFLAHATLSLSLAAIGAALLAVIVGLALAWQLTRPMRILTRAAHKLAEGELGQQVTVKATAELTELADAFNRMSHDLAAGEALRRRMAADIAHELRTPVSVLRGHLEAMLDGVFPLDTQRLAVAYDRTIHMARLVDDLRLLTRAEAGQLPLEHIVTAPEALISQAVESFAPLALDQEITLTHTVAPGLPPVAIDVDRIQQVLGNLITNALRHTPAEGTISLTVSQTGERVRFAVSNTGDGLTPDQAANVFRPFWRAEDARERDHGGSGLGLAISRQLIALHGGRIWVESGAAQTTFMFELPAQVNG